MIDKVEIGKTYVNQIRSLARTVVDIRTHKGNAMVCYKLPSGKTGFSWMSAFQKWAMSTLEDA